MSQPNYSGERIFLFVYFYTYLWLMISRKYWPSTGNVNSKSQVDTLYVLRNIVQYMRWYKRWLLTFDTHWHRKQKCWHLILTFPKYLMSTKYFYRVSHCNCTFDGGFESLSGNNCKLISGDFQDTPLTLSNKIIWKWKVNILN